MRTGDLQLALTVVGPNAEDMVTSRRAFRNRRSAMSDPIGAGAAAPAAKGHRRPCRPSTRRCPGHRRGRCRRLAHSLALPHRKSARRHRVDGRGRSHLRHVRPSRVFTQYPAIWWSTKTTSVIHFGCFMAGRHLARRLAAGSRGRPAGVVRSARWPGRCADRPQPWRDGQAHQPIHRQQVRIARLRQRRRRGKHVSEQRGRSTAWCRSTSPRPGSKCRKA